MSIVIKCPVCKKRMFDADEEAMGIITIKCPHCHNIVKIMLQSLIKMMEVFSTKK